MSAVSLVSEWSEVSGVGVSASVWCGCEELCVCVGWILIFEVVVSVGEFQNSTKLCDVATSSDLDLSKRKYRKR